MSSGKKKEIWKPIPGYKNYMVSNMGNVKSVDRYDNCGRFRKGRKLRSGINKGYLNVVLCDNGKAKTFGVHSLVMLAFVGELPKGHVVNHIDENPQNNHVDNLEYVTYKQNANHGTRNARLAESLRGKPKSEEHRNNISNARKGMVFTKEHKQKISSAVRKREARKVICIETGEVFDTISDAKDACGLSSLSGIREVCLGLRKTAGGYTWRFE